MPRTRGAADSVRAPGDAGAQWQHHHGAHPHDPRPQGLLKEKLQLEKARAPDGSTRWTIAAIDEQLSFDKVRLRRRRASHSRRPCCHRCRARARARGLLQLASGGAGRPQLSGRKAPHPASAAARPLSPLGHSAPPKPAAAPKVGSAAWRRDAPITCTPNLSPLPHDAAACADHRAFSCSSVPCSCFARTMRESCWCAWRTRSARIADAWRLHGARTAHACAPKHAIPSCIPRCAHPALGGPRMRALAWAGGQWGAPRQGMHSP